MTALNERFGNHHAVGDIRGRGLFQAVELVKDRAREDAVRPRRSGCMRGSSRRRWSAA